MSEQKLNSIWASFMPYLRPSLAVWQIMKFTPVAGILQGLMSFLLSLLHIRCLSPAYAQLREVGGWVLKDVTCVRLIDKMKPNTSEGPDTTEPVANPGPESTDPLAQHASCMQAIGSTGPWELNGASRVDPLGSTCQSEFNNSHDRALPGRGGTTKLNNVSNQAVPESLGTSESVKESSDHIEVCYLGKRFKLEKEGNKLYVDDKMSHYISDKQWRNICRMKKSCFEIADKDEEDKEKAALVFVKGYKRYWEKVVSGEVMTFAEALDSVIFDNLVVLTSHDVWLLPVNLSAPEEKLVMLLNLVGLFFPHNKTSLLFSRSLSIASAILELLEPLRSRIYGKINKMFCWSVQHICNKLPYAVRRYVYSLCMEVNNLKPCNDLRLKVEEGNIMVVIGGAAKTTRNGAAPVDWLVCREDTQMFVSRFIKFSIKGEFMEIEIEKEKVGECKVTVRQGKVDEHVTVKCKNREEFKKICSFLSLVADTESGSLKRHDEEKNRVYVREWRDSVQHYVDAGFPPVYKLRFVGVVLS